MVTSWEGPGDGGSEEVRHTAEWYRTQFGTVPMAEGAQVMIPCVGGPMRGRLETFPPRLEFSASGGVYVLVDDGPVPAWRYHFLDGAP